MHYLLPLKQKIQISLSLLLMLLMILPTQAQVKIGRRVKDRVERKVETRVLRKVDEAVDKVFDKAEDAAEEKAKEREAEREVEKSGGTTVGDDQVNVTVEEDHTPYVPTANEFVGTIKFRMEFYKNGRLHKNSPNYMTYTMDTWKSGMRLQDENKATTAEMIIDLQANTITTKIEGDSKQAMRMKRPSYKMTVESKHEADDIRITQTGDRETINGYNCEKYIISTPDETVEAWVTKDVETDYYNFAQTFNMKAGPRNAAASQHTNIYGLEGFPIRTTTTQSNGEVYKMEVESIQKGMIDREILSLDGYKIMTMPSFGG